MSLITPPEIERSRRDAQALIAEARAHARRRRLRLVVALMLLAGMAAAAVLIGRAATSTHAAAQIHPDSAPPAAGTGIVTGHLAACFGVASRNGPLPVTPGTVVVLWGTLSWKPDGPGTWRLVYPRGPAVASEHISNNYDQTFRFALRPGHYVIAGRYDLDQGRGYYTFKEVTVTAGGVLRVDLPNVCK